MLRVNALATEAPSIPNEGKMSTTEVLQGANHCTFPNLRSSLCKSSVIVREVGYPLHNAKDLDAVKDDAFVMFDDKTLSDCDAGNQDISNKTEEEEGSDVSVLDFIWNCSSCKQTHWVSCVFLLRRRSIFSY